MTHERHYTTADLLRAADFAARKHAGQRRKDPEATPYINHPIAVAELLACFAGVTDLVTLQAALLHDVLEDTETSVEEMDKVVGEEVRKVVQEVTDDKSLPQEERKRLQVEHGPHLSPRAKLIKLADKIYNIRAVDSSSPVGWNLERKLKYLDWSEAVVAGLRGQHAALEELFDFTVREKRSFLQTMG